MATVTTDKLDYAPGETTTITADGFTAGSIIEFHVEHVTDPGLDGIWGTSDDILGDNSGLGHEVWYVTDGGAGDLDGVVNGIIETTWFVNPDDSLNETFLLTATGDGVDATFNTVDDEVATTTFTDAGGAYTLNFAAADPGLYIPDVPFPSNLTAPIGRGDGEALIPLAQYNDGITDVKLESLAPQDMALGQIVPFELKISVSGDITPENGVITFVLGWDTLTTNGNDFGYDARGDDIGYGVFGAFIDTGDGAFVDSGDNATVDSFSWSLINDEIVGIFTVSGLDDGDMVVLEPWLVLDDTIETGVGGNVASRLIDAATGSDQTITVAPSGTISLDNGDAISTGNQTVPLLKPSDFFTAEVDLSVTKVDDIDPIVQGETLTYTITTSNAPGSAVANSVVVYDELDPNVTFVSASDGGFINTDTGDLIPDGAVQWDVGALAPGETVEYTVTVTVNLDAPTDSLTGEDLLNTVTVTTISDDTDLTNNIDTEPTDVLSAVQLTDLVATKSVTSITNPDSSGGGALVDQAGDVINYEITLDNLALYGSLTGITLTDDLLQGVNGTLAAPTGDTDNDNELDPDEIWTYTGTYTVTQADLDSNGTLEPDNISAGFIDNTATGDSNETNPDSASASVLLEQLPSMSITKVATAINGDTADTTISAAGDIVTYSIVVTNTGNETLTNVLVTDDLTGFSTTIVSLAPDASETFTTTYTVLQSDIDNNGGGDSDIDNTATAADDVAADVTASEEVPLVQDPLMEITKVATFINGVAITGDAATDPVITAAGDIVTYAVVVTNTGNETLTNVAVTDPLTGMNELIVSLAPSDSASFTTTYTVLQSDIDNNGGGDSDIDNTATAADDVAADVTASEEVPLVQDPLMEITKVATFINGVAITGDAATDPVITAAGDIVTYAVVVTNTGNETLTNVAVTDPLTGMNELIVSLAPSDSASFTTTYTVLQSDIDNNGGGDSDIDNTATAADDVAADVTASEEVPLVQDPLMEITKVATFINGVAITGDAATDPVITAAGDIVTYAVVVTNTGNETLTNVAVTDPLTGMNETILSLAPSDSASFTTTYTVLQSDIDNNGGGDSDIDNTATAADDVAADVTASEEVPLVQDPLMEITKVATFINGVAITGDAATDPVITAAGDIVTYAVVVTNTGNETLTNVAVTDPLTGMNETIVSLAPSDSASFTTTYTVLQSDIDTNGGGDSDVDNTVTATDDRAGEETADEAVPLVQLPGIKIDKVTGNGAINDDGLSILSGSNIIWTYTVTNTGNVTLENVDVSDDNGTLSTDDDFNPSYTSGDVNDDGKLDLNETWLYQASGTAQSGNYSNIGTATGSYSEGTVDDTDPSSYFGADPAIAIDKVTADAYGNEGDGIGVLPGESVTWKYTVTNTGNVALANVSVDDDMLDDIDDPIFVSGDINDNGLLDLTETWLYEATGIVPDDLDGDGVFGGFSYNNTGIATGDFTDDVENTETTTASDGSSYYALEPGYMTNSSLCDFGDQFDLVFTPDLKNWDNTPAYKLSDSNPGQFYYNLFYVAGDLDGSGDINGNEVGDTVTIEIPYPFVTQGATPVHAYSGVTVGNDGTVCFEPGTEIFNDQLTFILGDYTDTNGDGSIGYGDTYTMTVLGLPTDGFVYLNLHMDYGLEKTDGWDLSGKNAINDPDVNLDLDGVDILNLTDHIFDSSIAGSTDSIANNNDFKDPKGFGGLVYTQDTVDGATTTPGIAIEGAVIDLYKTSDYLSGNFTKILDTATTDEHGWYFMENFTHKGKQTDYTVVLRADTDGSDQITYLSDIDTTLVGRGDKFGEAYFEVENTYVPTALASLNVADGTNTGEQSGLTLQNEHLPNSIINAAINYWESLGIDADKLEALSEAEFEIEDLGGTLLAETSGSTITLDDDAAGYGWSLAIGDVKDDAVDLLSTVTHEFGHLLDLDHDGLDSVMNAELAVGDRTVDDVNPSANDQSGPVVYDQVDLVGVQDFQVDEFAA